MSRRSSAVSQRPGLRGYVGLYRDNGNEKGNSYLGFRIKGLGFRFRVVL